MFGCFCEERPDARCLTAHCCSKLDRERVEGHVLHFALKPFDSLEGIGGYFS